MTESELMRWAIEKINQAVTDKMYGAITIKFENGRIVATKTEKTEKPCIKE